MDGVELIVEHNWQSFPGRAPSDMYYEWCCICGVLKVIYDVNDIEYFTPGEMEIDSGGKLMGSNQEPSCKRVTGQEKHLSQGHLEKESGKPVKIVDTSKKHRVIGIEETTRRFFSYLIFTKIISGEIIDEIEAGGGIFGAMALRAKIMEEK